MGLLVNTWELIDQDRLQGKSWDEIGERRFDGASGTAVKNFYYKYAAEVMSRKETTNDQD